MHIGVISFPGSNGDHDALANLEADLGVTVRRVDYRETTLAGLDAVVLPGGFSYGDALRCGAIARFAPIMTEVQKAAEDGMPILGMCNGFQVLTESHLLPGALLRNETLRFHCFRANIRIENNTTSWTNALEIGDVLNLPVAHGEGAYYIDDEGLRELEANNQIVARYCEPDGTVTPRANRNGSVANIAGVSNAEGNVVGLMPHPERATNELVGGADGLRLLRSVLSLETSSVR
jgi:phosphoribosylformylglycinamidine synthase subunit PurQ / glutaminase